MKIFLFTILVSNILVGCSTSPTGRRQLKLMPSEQMSALGSQSFSSLKKTEKVSQNQNYRRKIKCITDRLLIAMGESPSTWKIEIFENKAPNAFALPGNNMGIHTGMIELAANDSQIAAVIGHEIGHVLASHGNERVSQNAIVQLGMTATQIYLGQSGRGDQMILASLGLGAQFGILLPFSRSHETEADALGIKYMAKAGFNPREAAELWKVMKANAGNSGPEFLSTHPSPETRIKKLQALAPQYFNDYEANKKRNGC
jgi:predicted Zn-dependent protease